LLLLSACSDLALPNEEMPPAAADPSYFNVVAYYLKGLFKDQAYYDAFEVSAFRWVHSLKGWSWLACELLEAVPMLRTHDLVVLRKPAGAAPA